MRIERERLDRKVAPEDCIELINGKEIWSLRNLVVAIEKMSNDVFLQHASKSHNDFADWILDALGEEGLSKKIRKAGRKRTVSILRVALEKEHQADASVKRISIPKKRKDALESIGGLK